MNSTLKSAGSPGMIEASAASTKLKVSISRERLTRLTFTLVLMVMGLMALGAGVRTMNAGLSCPDWPLCFGKVIPDFHVGTYFEFIHRAYAGLVSITFLAVLYFIQTGAGIPPTVKKLGWMALGFLGLQIVMGGLTVLRLLKAVVVTGHLLLATAFVSTLLWIAMSLYGRIAKASKPLPRWFLALLLIFPGLVLFQLALGGFVASTYSGLVCVDFPTCNGQWFPAFSGPIGLQVLHRIGAYTIAVFALSIFCLTFKSSVSLALTPQTKNAIVSILAAIGVQIALGIANLYFYIPPSLAVLHHFTGVLVLLLTLRLAFIARHLRRA